MTRKLSFLFLSAFFIILFIKLGFWQYYRGLEKRQIIDDAQHSKVLLSGYFDYEHQFFVENQFHNHQVGYHVLTPFIIGKDQAMLVNRGWIKNADQLIQNIKDETYIKIQGIVRKPSYTLILGENFRNNDWPIKIQRIELKKLAEKLNYKINTDSYILMTNPKNMAFTTDWKLINMPPEKHFAYSVQWFSLALVSLIGTVFFLKKL